MSMVECGPYEYLDVVMHMCCSCLNLCHRGIHAYDTCRRQCPVYYNELRELQNEESNPEPETARPAYASRRAVVAPTVMETQLKVKELEQNKESVQVNPMLTNTVIIILGIMVVALLVGLLLCFVCKRKRKNDKVNETEKGIESEADPLTGNNTDSGACPETEKPTERKTVIDRLTGNSTDSGNGTSAGSSTGSSEDATTSV